MSHAVLLCLLSHICDLHFFLLYLGSLTMLELLNTKKRVNIIVKICPNMSERGRDTCVPGGQLPCWTNKRKTDGCRVFMEQRPEVVPLLPLTLHVLG